MLVEMPGTRKDARKKMEGEGEGGGAGMKEHLVPKLQQTRRRQLEASKAAAQVLFCVSLFDSYFESSER